MDMNPLVGIRCLVYNQEKTIRQTLEGFIKQQTDFPFIAVVHDDASTDETASIIKEYAEKYPNIIKPIFEKKNVYQNCPRGTLEKIMNEALKDCKYIAICEGDDYWISPNKISQQVKYLESHSEYAMCCSDAVIITNTGEENWSISSIDRDLTPDEIIKGGGLYIPTASIIYRKNVKDNYPAYCQNCHVGDYPLQIMCSLKGKVRYFSEKMVAYRFAMGNSWTANNRKKSDLEKQLISWMSELDMLEGLNKYSNQKYHKYFMERELTYIIECAFNNLDNAPDIINKMLKCYPSCADFANIKNRLKIFIARHHLIYAWRIFNLLKR